MRINKPVARFVLGTCAIVGTLAASTSVAKGMQSAPQQPESLACEKGELIRSENLNYPISAYKSATAPKTPEMALDRRLSRSGGKADPQGDLSTYRQERRSESADRVEFVGRDERGVARSIVIAQRGRDGDSWLPVATYACVPGAPAYGPGPGGDDDEE